MCPTCGTRPIRSFVRSSVRFVPSATGLVNDQNETKREQEGESERKQMINQLLFWLGRLLQIGP